MARTPEWQREAREAVRREAWTLRGPSQVVKVVPAGGSAALSLGGYITIGRSLLNKTPIGIQAALGLPAGYLAAGARIYHFARLPQVSEYDYELTANYPDGLVYGTVLGDLNYPPGDRTIHQWRIRPGVHIPVDSTNFLDLRPDQVFPYAWLMS